MMLSGLLANANVRPPIANLAETEHEELVRIIAAWEGFE